MKKICLIAAITLVILLSLGLTTESFAKEKLSGAGRRVLIGFKDGAGRQANLALLWRFEIEDI